ncbi:HlyD family type I secretion periplasmic adaptor subunit [uncultured Desulfobulbus sp.]|uniref:HlyD family type I secretion periplasmic adaptor subunit n=1 Tax=uncultured Desulfobulbus sp. TaxID=239745 RepID=UPI0029C8C1C0|nr:HlyD family type I secretion periplasmic adaptor subunit [uncultured Desulfobulbus sp.]
MISKHRREAYVGLLRHYRNVFRHYWQKRKELGGGLFTENEAEFLPAALSLQEKPVSPTSRFTAKVLMVLVALMLAWSIFGRIDIIVNATGEIIPSERTKTIASVDVGSVKALHVVEGQVVKKGDLLIELDTSAPDAERDKALSSIIEATLQAARSRAMIAAVDSRKRPTLATIEGIPNEKLHEAQRHLDGQFLDFIAKLQRLEGAVSRLALSLPLVTQRAADYKELAKGHDVSQHAYLEKEQARVDLEGQLVEAISQSTALIAETRRVAFDALAESEKILGAARQDALRASSHGRLLNLVAPVDGTVQQLTVHTIGGVVPAAQPLMLIVPKEDRLEVEAFLENKDVGFVEVGQVTAVKVDAFEYTKYGTVPSRVVHVSRDAIKDEKKGLIYSVRVALDTSTISVNGHATELSPGMSVKVDIRTGSRRVIEYVLSPLLQHKQESFNER